MKLLAAEFFLFLISLLISNGFVYGEQGCTEKFMELSQVTYRAQHTSATATGMIGNDKIRALPEYQFNCSSTNIASLILGIDVRRATGSINLFPSVRVYRPSSNDPGKYDLVTGSERTIYYSTSNVSTSGVFEYPLNPPIPVMGGDVIAVVQPLEEESVVRVYYIEGVSGISFSSSQEISISPDQIDLSSLITNQFILVYPVTDGYCVNSTNSITPSVIRNNFLAIQSSGDIDDRRQYLYPEIVFSCNGSLTKWIYGGIPDSGSNKNELPELQIWRQLGPNNYNKIESSLVNANTMIGTNLYEFIPQTPLQFQEGDIFGVHIPHSTQSLFHLYEQVGNGPLNEQVNGNADNPYSTITQALVTDTTNDFPLVTVEVSISVASTSVASSTSTSPVISTTSVITTSTALTTATISTTVNTIISSTVVSITPSSTSSVSLTVTPSSSVTAVIPPSISSIISISDNFNPSLLSLTYSSSSFDIPPVSSMVIITTAPSDSSVTATTVTSTAPSSTSVMTSTPSSSMSMADATSTSVATSTPSGTSMMTSAPSSSSASTTDATSTSVATSTPSGTSMMTNAPSSSSASMIDTASTSVATSTPSGTSMMTSAPSSSSASTTDATSTSVATSTPSSTSMVTNTPSSSSSVITGATTPSSSLTDSITSSSLTTSSSSVLLNPTPDSGASTAIASTAVVISLLVLFIAISVGAIIVLLFVMKKRKRRYKDRVTLLTASFSASSTLRSEEGFTINNIVYEDVDKLSGPVTYDHYETAPEVPQRTSTVSNPLYSDTDTPQRTTTISNPLYGDKSFEAAAAVESAYETLITEKEPSSVNDTKVEGRLPDDQVNIYDELKNQSALPSAKCNEEPHYWAPGDDTSSIYQQMESKGYKQLKRKDITISNELGSGEFGTVYEGMWLSKPIAIKTLKNSSVEEDKVKFLQEAAIMGQFHHPNIVKLYGMVTVGEPMMIVLELIPHGDMRQYLDTLQPQPGELVASTVPGLLLSFCRQIASGMEYLSKKGFVHRDLAARNILIADHGMCKIADFGMSRDLHDENYYVSNAKMIPVKWTSPEALSYRRYSSASDIWSYGVVMYEIWSLGHKPFENFSNQEYVKLIDTGYRLPPPPGCPRPIYKIMIQCWHPKTSGRPTIADIVSRFGSSDMKKLNEVVEREGTVLGGPLESAYDVYTDLQNTYTIN